MAILFRTIVFIGASLAALTGCGVKEKKEQAKPKVLINLTDQNFKYDTAKEIYDLFVDFAKQETVNIPTKDIFTLIKVLEPTRVDILQDEIEKNFPNGIDLTCNNQKCSGTTIGKETTIKLEGVDSAGFKDPEVIFAKELGMAFRVDTANVLEVCRIEGVRIKSGLSAKFDGAYLAVDEASIREFKIDVGAFGPYPNKNCD